MAYIRSAHFIAWIMPEAPIPFNFPHMTGRELAYIDQAHASGQLAGNGAFTKRCHCWIERQTGCTQAFLTHSCTAALEMAALLLELEPGDEVILPSFTFVSTANAFVLRRAVPVFVDVREDTLNLDERLVAAAVTARTRAIVPVHYAGVGCDMDSILACARGRNLAVVEDAAQGVMARYRGRALGTLGALGAFSFHETKNVISGEGGALLVNDAAYRGRAEVIWEKGTDRSRFFRGEVDKYTWQDVGSSFLPGELTAAFLAAQLESAETITARRLAIWHNYHARLAGLEARGRLRRPIVPAECQHNAHMYYVILAPELDRARVLGQMKAAGIHAVSHYVPLHSSPAGRRFARASGELAVTSALAPRVVRLPLWVGLTEAQQDRVCEVLARVVA